MIRRAPVGRSIVDDDDFLLDPAQIDLVHAVEHLLDGLRFVVDGNDDRELVSHQVRSRAAARDDMPIHSSPAVQPDSGGGARLALAVALALAWTNLLTTGRWADEPGALHGRRLWPYAMTLAVATLVTLLVGPQQGEPAPTTSEGRGVAAAGAAMLAAAFLTTFPPGLWNQIPFYDDWPGLLQLTLNGIDTLKHGAVVGWQWAFLGGYQTSADLSQSLAVPAWLPIALAGPTSGSTCSWRLSPSPSRWPSGSTSGPPTAPPREPTPVGCRRSSLEATSPR